jgi:hypothetical protein
MDSSFRARLADAFRHHARMTNAGDDPLSLLNHACRLRESVSPAHQSLEVVHETALAKETDHLLAVPADFVNLAKRSVSGYGIVSLAGDCYSAQEQWFHDLISIVCEVPVFGPPQETKQLLAGRSLRCAKIVDRDQCTIRRDRAAFVRYRDLVGRGHALRRPRCCCRSLAIAASACCRVISGFPVCLLKGSPREAKSTSLICTVRKVRFLNPS